MRDRRGSNKCKIRKAVQETDGQGWTISPLHKVGASDLSQVRQLERDFKQKLNPNLNESVPHGVVAEGGFVETSTRCHPRNPH